MRRINNESRDNRRISTIMMFKQIQLLQHIENNPNIPVHFNDKGVIIEGITDINSTLYITLTLRSLVFRGLVEVVDDCKVRITDKGIKALTVADRVQEVIKDGKCTTMSSER